MLNSEFIYEINKLERKKEHCLHLEFIAGNRSDWINVVMASLTGHTVQCMIKRRGDGCPQIHPRTTEILFDHVIVKSAVIILQFLWNHSLIARLKLWATLALTSNAVEKATCQRRLMKHSKNKRKTGRNKKGQTFEYYFDEMTSKCLPSPISHSVNNVLTLCVRASYFCFISFHFYLILMRTFQNLSRLRPWSRDPSVYRHPEKHGGHRWQ